ncbi:MAG: hypothetical protein ACRDNS_17440 [Trebonia sp.]
MSGLRRRGDGCFGSGGRPVTAGNGPAGTAHVLFQLVNRMDGGKMLVLAVLGAAVAAALALPRWLRYTGGALAVAIAASGVVYLLLMQSLALLAGPALVLLLIFITGAGIWLGGTGRGR